MKYSKKMNKISSSLKRVVLLLSLLAVVGEVWGTNYIFKSGDYYMGVSGGSLVGKTTFDLTCIWTSCNGQGEEQNAGTSTSNLCAFYALEGSKRYYLDYESDTNHKLITSSSAYKKFYLDGSTFKFIGLTAATIYYVTWNDSRWEGRTNSGKGKHPSITTESARGTTQTATRSYEIKTFSLTPTAVTFSELNQSQTFTASATAEKTERPSYYQITLDGTNYYINASNQARYTSAPSSSSSTTGVSYTWTLPTLNSYTSNSSSGNTATMKYSTGNYTGSDVSGEVSLKVYCTDNTGTYKTTTATVTVKSLPTFYYLPSASVNITGKNLTAATDPSTQGSIQGTTSGQTSATTTVKYTATVPSDKSNLYKFGYWSTSEDGTSLSTDNPYNYSATITSKDSGSPTTVSLWANFKPLSRLKVISKPTGFGYVSSVGDSPYSGTDFTSTEDVTTRDDGKSHTMYMYARPKQSTTSSGTLDQYRFKGWSSTGSLTNIDGGTTAMGQTVTVGSPEYKEFYAMFVAFYKFQITAIPVSNGSANSTAGGTVNATFTEGQTHTTDNADVETSTDATKGTKMAIFTATAKTADGYQFEGWSETANGDIKYKDNPYKPTLENSSTGTTLSYPLYARFVKMDPPESISIGNDRVEDLATGTITIPYTVTPDNAYTLKNIKYKSSNTAVATVDETTGEVKFVGVGETNITATAYKQDGTSPACSATIKLTIKSKMPNPEVDVTADPDNLDQAKVTITAGEYSPAGTKIYYTTDGSEPTASSTEYTDPFYIQNGTTVKAIAPGINANWMTSDIISKIYSKQKTARVQIDVNGNEVTFNSSSEPNVTYYYTTDGTTPTNTHGTAWTRTNPVVPIKPENDVDIKVIALKTGLGPSDVATQHFNRVQIPTPEIQIAGDRVWFLCGEPGVTFYYTTDGSTPTTSSTKWNGDEITNIADNSTIKVYAVKKGYQDSKPAEKKKLPANVVYLDFASGNDSNDGKTATTAKKTFAGAYAVLGFGPNAKYLRANWAKNGLTTLSGHTCFDGTTDEDFNNTVDNNIIYLVGDVSATNLTNLFNKTGTASSETILMSSVLSSGFFKPATISGRYATKGSASDGRPVVGLSASDNHILNEDTRFEYVEFEGSSSGTNETQFLLAYYDLEMGKCITNKGFLSTKKFSTYHHGYAQGVTNTAHILFYGGHQNDSRFTSGTKELQFDDYLPHPDGYKITIRSGYFSTISPGGKQWNSNINGVMGSPNTPVKCTITVDVDRYWNDQHKSGVLRDQSSIGDPDCDVAVLIAGTHEGSIYGDVDIIVKSGRVDRVVNGTFGAHNQITGYPCDSYFGRANILIDPREPSTDEAASYPTKDDLVVIRELYGGGLGRYKSTSGTAEAATNFYGKSTVTINGGTFSSAIYASGAGGCNGIGDDAHHTVDKYIPYGGNTSAPTYGDYTAWKAAGTKTVVKCMNSDGNREDIDLAKTSTKIEIHGGKFGSSTDPIDGIFGGGYGYVDKELIADGVPAHTQAGSIFAAAGELASSVTIDGHTEIYGNVYGAGRGTNYYVEKGKSGYTALALISGNTELTIGGHVKVHGSVFGAGEGISTLENMARLYGDSKVTIQDYAHIEGGVYGGGQDGSMDGNLELHLLGDAKIGTDEKRANVHGGGYGSTTTVGGNVDVHLGDSQSDEPFIYGDIYGGSALGKVNTSASNTTKVTLESATVYGSVYGGGLGDATTAADVNGKVQVRVNAGSVKKTSVLGSGGVYGCNNVNGTPKSTVEVDVYGTDPIPADASYALYAVYGGGNQSAYTGTPIVRIHKCDNSIEYVYGGGNAAPVAGTDVTIYGGDIIGNVFGGGNGSSEGWPSGTENPGANVTTNGTKVKIYGGKILSVFGGSNTKGLITGGTSVVVNGQDENGKYLNLCSMDVDDIYGAGNNAPMTGDTKVEILNVTGTVGNVFGGGKGATAVVTGNSDVIIGDWDKDHNAYVAGNVYGGGDKAQLTGTAKVTLNDCASIIDGDVYGGGNESLVGHTNVTAWGSTVKGDLYGGGRGTDAVSADVGTTTVAGNATTNVYGGSYGGIFGGGNIKSDIFGTAKLFIDEKACTATDATKCDFSAGEVYGAGNKAKISGTIDFSLGCIHGKIDEIYGGAKEADIDNDVVLNITSGKFGSVFGGNNLGGTITGTITVNVQHTGCEPIEIENLFGGGNLADYTVPTSSTDKNFPRINIKTCGLSSPDWVNDGKNQFHCLKIGTIYGAGKGENGNDKGKVTGNPTINVNAGEIGTIFGGGNTADVDGDTYVNVIDKDKTDEQDIYITGNVYGGGSAANVTGNTHVQIGEPK